MSLDEQEDDEDGMFATPYYFAFSLLFLFIETLAIVLLIVE